MEGGAPGSLSPTPAPPPARPIGPGPVMTPPPGGAEQTVQGPVRTWGLATGGTVPGASVGPLVCCDLLFRGIDTILYTRTLSICGLCR